MLDQEQILPFATSFLPSYFSSWEAGTAVEERTAAEEVRKAVAAAVEGYQVESKTIEPD